MYSINITGRGCEAAQVCNHWHHSGSAGWGKFPSPLYRLAQQKGISCWPVSNTGLSPFPPTLLLPFFLFSLIPALPLSPFPFLLFILPYFGRSPLPIPFFLFCLIPALPLSPFFSFYSPVFRPFPSFLFLTFFLPYSGPSPLPFPFPFFVFFLIPRGLSLSLSFLFYYSLFWPFPSSFPFLSFYSSLFFPFSPIPFPFPFFLFSLIPALSLFPFLFIYSSFFSHIVKIGNKKTTCPVPLFDSLCSFHFPFLLAFSDDSQSPNL